MAIDVTRSAPPPLGRWLQLAVGNVMALVNAYRQVRLERAQLLALSDRDLRDISISRVDVIREAQKPLWRASIMRVKSTNAGTREIDDDQG